MGISNLFKPFFTTIIIGVTYDINSCSVAIKRIRSGIVVGESKKDFKIVNSELSMDVIKFIKKLKDKYSFSYLSVLSKVNEHYLIPDPKNRLNSFGIYEEKEYRTLKIQNAVIFIKKSDVIAYDKKFKKMNYLDYLFSPFILLHLKSKDFLTDEPKLFILQEKDTMSLYIANRKKIFYGNFILSILGEIQAQIKEEEKTKEREEKEEKTKAIEDDEIDTGDDNFEDLIDLADLDSELADLDNFDFNFGESSKDSESEDENLDGLQDLARSTNIVNMIQKSLRDYYKNELYEKNFIEKIVIFDCYGISLQSMENIKNTLMIEVAFESIELSKEIATLAQLELNP